MNRRYSEPQPGTYTQMLDAIIEKFNDTVPILNVAEWKDTMRNVYVGNKHAETPAPDFQTMYQTTMQGLIILRMWLGIQLGADIVKMQKMLGQDEIGKKIRNFLV
ncbi:hypothetical protein CUU80_01835 [Bifidobacterium scaligerum]|uniref:Uncharacterized protein n=2 Tax=Bifidobacterium scaligerum TaxID=2052656 RepID=A0A2M9HSX0_9BIFI|nr:hypothetical protein CUU80_01835 [Bifidobacterium scaligerum]